MLQALEKEMYEQRSKKTPATKTTVKDLELVHMAS